jgi:hypothetical protein
MECGFIEVIQKGNEFMINIISKSYYRKFQSGPKKVVDNLIKGLDKIGYPYVINKQLDACKRLWVHDDIAALRLVAALPPEIKVVVGPNLVVMPRNLPQGFDLSRCIYLHPSNWAIRLWETHGFKNCPMHRWPVGIDTEEFHPSQKIKQYALIYFKQRYERELDAVLETLKKKNISYQLVVYGAYREKKYKEFLGESKYVIWLGRHDTQGIALQEALATNTPMLIWDVQKLGEWNASEKEMSIFTPEEKAFEPVTSAEYFDQTCGLKIKNENELDAAVNYMEQQWQTFTPQKYILENLSLEKQAREFVEIYHTYFGLTFEEGLKEGVRANGNWVNRDFSHRVTFLAKDIVKTALQLLH